MPLTISYREYSNGGIFELIQDTEHVLLCREPDDGKIELYLLDVPGFEELLGILSVSGSSSRYWPNIPL